MDCLVIRADRGIACEPAVSCIRVFIGSFDHDCGQLGSRWYGCASIGTEAASARAASTCRPSARVEALAAVFR